MIRDNDAAEDIVQSVFIRIWKNLDRIVLKSSLKSYLFQSARNATIDYIRKNGHKVESLDGVDVMDQDEGISFDAEAENYLLRERLMGAIEKLKPKTQEIFKLHKLEGLTYPEIAEYMKIPQRTVEYNIYTAISQLKIILLDTYKDFQN